MTVAKEEKTTFLTGHPSISFKILISIKTITPQKGIIKTITNSLNITTLKPTPIEIFPTRGTHTLNQVSTETTTITTIITVITNTTSIKITILMAKTITTKIISKGILKEIQLEITADQITKTEIRVHILTITVKFLSEIILQIAIALFTAILVAEMVIILMTKNAK